MMTIKFVREVLDKSMLLYSEVEVEKAIDHMADAMVDVFVKENPLFLVVMIGGIVLAGKLMSRFNFPLQLDYIHATRYCSGLIGKEIAWQAYPSCSLAGRVVILVDDILDGGITLSKLMDHCKHQGAQKVYSAVLVDKKRARPKDGITSVDFVGLPVENHYIFGYGMDYKGYWRNASGIYQVAPEHELA